MLTTSESRMFDDHSHRGFATDTEMTEDTGQHGATEERSFTEARNSYLWLPRLRTVRAIDFRSNQPISRQARGLGPGLLESAYTPCLLYELHARNLRYESVAAVLPVHGAQTLTYMRLTNTPAGLVINFNVPRLMDGVRRLLLKDRFAAPSAETSKGPSSEERS